MNDVKTKCHNLLWEMFWFDYIQHTTFEHCSKSDHITNNKHISYTAKVTYENRIIKWIVVTHNVNQLKQDIGDFVTEICNENGSKTLEFTCNGNKSLTKCSYRTYSKLEIRNTLENIIKECTKEGFRKNRPETEFVTHKYNINLFIQVSQLLFPFGHNYMYLE